MPQKTQTLFAVALLALALGAGCSKKGDKGEGDTASCDAVAEHWMTVAKAEVDRLEGEEKKHAEAMLSLLPKLKNQMIAECKKDKWSKAARECILEAKDADAVRACKKYTRPEGGASEEEQVEGKPGEEKPAAAEPAKDEPVKDEAAGAEPANTGSEETEPVEGKESGGGGGKAE